MKSTAEVKVDIDPTAKSPTFELSADVKKIDLKSIKLVPVSEK